MRACVQTYDPEQSGAFEMPPGMGEAEAYEGRIVECSYDAARPGGAWVFMRERTDKDAPNADSVYRKVRTAGCVPQGDCRAAAHALTRSLTHSLTHSLTQRACGTCMRYMHACVQVMQSIKDGITMEHLTYWLKVGGQGVGGGRDPVE